jgi:adenosine deaminase
MRQRICVLLLATSLITAAQSVEQRFDELRKSPPELYAFLLRMPKGGDLHNHLSGAIYAEEFLERAKDEKLCVDTSSQFLAPPATSGYCVGNQVDASVAERINDIRNRFIDGVSMRDFVPGAESGHDHFFATFSKFGAASSTNVGDEVVRLVRRAVEQNESYLELMTVSGSGPISALGKEAGFEDFETTRRKLIDAGLEQQVATLRGRIDEIERDRIQALHCDTQPDSAPCRVTVRYQFYVLRESAKEQVFAQMLAGFMLCATDRRMAGINLVQPEDGYTSMHDYHLQMQMIDFVKRLYPKVHISLHAGELTSGVVPPEGLRFHIREAVELGHAERIGHGVDIMYENESLNTLRTMRERHVDIEINLTSNAQILGVKGDDHPFPVYRKYGVPTTISTDDEGVSRTHLTQEYQRAVLTYGLSYSDVKELARNSIEYSFLPGESLWRNASYRSMDSACAGGMRTSKCQDFLKANDKARLQADLEERFRTFEAEELRSR